MALLSFLRMQGSVDMVKQADVLLVIHFLKLAERLLAGYRLILKQYRSADPDFCLRRNDGEI